MLRRFLQIYLTAVYLQVIPVGNLVDEGRGRFQRNSELVVNHTLICLVIATSFVSISTVFVYDAFSMIFKALSR